MENNWDKFWAKRTGPMSKRTKHVFAMNFRILYQIYLNHLIGTPGISSDRTVLEVGCGRGTLSEQFRKNGFTTFGVDIQTNLTKKYPGSLAIANGTSLPFPDNSFDMGFTYGLLEHFSYEDQLELITEINRVVKDRRLSVHYVVPRKIVNIFEDRDVYRSRCKILEGVFEPTWVYPAFGEGTDWFTNKYLGKAFLIVAQNSYGERDEEKANNRSTNNGEVPQHKGSREELQTPWGNGPT